MSSDVVEKAGNEPEYFTPEQLAARLQVARNTIKKWTVARNGLQVQVLHPPP